MFGSLMGDLEDDPFFGSHMRSMRQMSSMMNMFSDPFSMMGGMGMGMGLGGMRHPAITNGPPRHRNQNQLMPFGFPDMDSIFQNVGQMGNSPNCHSFSSSTVMTMTKGPDGRPQVYQASSSTRTAPGGVRETKKSVSDSRTGTKKLAIGHHIGERAHIIEREHNLNSGEQEEREELINLDEEEAPEFNKEFERRTRQAGATLGALGYHGHGHGQPRQKALMDSSRSRHTGSRSYLPNSRRAHLALPAPPPGEGVRQQQEREPAKKRDHDSDEERQAKCLKPSVDSDVEEVEDSDEDVEEEEEEDEEEEEEEEA